MGRTRALKLNLNRTFEERDFPSKANKLDVGKNDKVDFEPACVFSEKKTKLLRIIPRFWKLPRNLVIFVDGAKSCLKFKEGDDPLLMPYWTKEEATEHVEKEIAKARVKESLISWGKAIIIIILLVAVLILQIYSMNRAF